MSWQSLAITGDERTDKMSGYLTIPEVANLLRIGVRNTYELARSGRLVGAAKVGNQWRVERESLMEWLRKGGEAAIQRDLPQGEKR